MRKVSRGFRWRLCSSVAVLAAGSAATAALPPGYTIQAVIPPGETSSVSVRGLFNDGTLGIEVSRGSTPNTVGNVAAYYRSAAGVWRSATIPPGNNQINQLGAIDNFGNMYGTWRVNNQALDQRAFISRADGTFIDLGRTPNAAGNLSNTFVGGANATHIAYRNADTGFTYNLSTGVATRLEAIRGDGVGLSTVNYANELGHFVGVSPQAAGSNQTRATIWRINESGVYVPINLGLPADPGPTDISTGLGLSDNGAAVGWTGTASNFSGFYWTESGGMVRLARSSATNHQASDVNDSGLIVGRRTVGNTITAVVWDGPMATPLDLLPMVEGAAGWELLEAVYINNSGLILGRGTLNGISTMFLLTPIPEPASVGVLGVVCVGALARRRA